MPLIKISEPITEKTPEQLHEVVIGIDLGTTNSLAAIIENDKVKFFADTQGREIIPSIAEGTLFFAK